MAMDTYRCYKHFDETCFLPELTTDLDMLVTDHTTIDDDMLTWSSNMLKHLNRHAPLNAKRLKFKNKRLPDWFKPQII